MKLIRFGEVGRERPGVLLEDQTVLDVQSMAFDIHGYDRQFFEKCGLERLAFLQKEPGRKTLPAKGLRLGPPVSPGGKIICMGKNYADHAREFGSEPPDYPIFFSKPWSAVIGPHDTVVLPEQSRIVDVEVELAVVMGRTCRGISPEEAGDYILGYTILNDISDREVQKKGRQWFRAKGADTFCPLGPVLYTQDELADPHSLKLVSRINGQVIQEGKTSDMIFRIPEQVAALSESITLFPGDIIATGTPAGIGSVKDPPITLQDGDEIEIEIEGLGKQQNLVSHL